MSLYVIPVLDPVPGKDWLYTVPGQYLETIVSVTASLTNDGGLTTVMHDSSGNNRDGTYAGNTFDFDQRVPGLIAGDTAVAFLDVHSFFGSPLLIADNVNDWSGDWSCEWWMRTPIGLPGTENRVQVADSAIPAGWTMETPVDVTGVCSIRDIVTDGGFDSNGAIFPNDNARHHLVWTCTAGVPALYFDGVAIVLVAVPPGGVFTGALPRLEVARDVDNFPPNTVTWDELAVYDHALSAARVAAHFAAAGTFAAYSTAVLADSPSAYYHLDDAGPGAGRTVALEITDGQHVVGDFCTGFGAPFGPSPYTYSWIANQSQNAQSANGATTTVGLPPLLLPAGYTIGTFTPDIGSTDQWSNIVIWWDDTLMRQMEGFLYPPGAHLVYQQVQ